MFMNMRAFLLLGFAAVIGIFSSCKKEKLKADTASFLVVNQVAVSSGTVAMAQSHKITDIWLYVDDRFVGIYPIGSIMPVVNNGTATIRMYAGIVNNGIAGTRLPYTFYSPYIYNATFEAGKTYTLSPTFEYKSGLQIQDDSFSGSGSYFASFGDIPPVIITDPSKVWGGTGGSVYMTVSDARPLSILKSSSPLALPVGGTEIYLEMDYKCNHEFTVGVIGADLETRLALTLRPTNGWKKVYISLTSVVSTQPTYTSYKIFVQALKSASVASPEIYLDNLRLVRP